MTRTPLEARIDQECPVQSGGTIPGTSEPAFSLRQPSDCPIPVMIAAPHAGRAYSPALLRAMRDPEYSAIRLEDRHVDRIALEIARQTGAGLLVAHAPRAMIDLNRASDDVDWEMIRGGQPANEKRTLANRRSRTGLGLVPRRLARHGEIWKEQISREELDARIEGVHRPYHQALAKALETVRDRWGAVLLIDLHSMPPLRPRHEGDRPPEIVIGDRFGASSDGLLVAGAFAYLARQEKAVAHNRPYAGGYVLDRHAAPARGIHAMQIELCRSAYLDRRLQEPSARMAGVVRLVAGLVRELGDTTAALGRTGSFSIAAE
ncbi:N-formylglutamate amidohydrolase [Allopontixanthobacter sediminis]|uniref:N-formylglutamate amidohydrolase n=1 Tax=Allopontixanthobacter sediminis TaxID=1689985 RepID=A0A845B6V3_9SPHN|nr:N-formylglutamate amidohydrolase [Allopontixanthobacter sediminis]MXP43359.1 N-formylglutamate amidohydrolase [Allopontixanthobacter sediminis]